MNQSRVIFLAFILMASAALALNQATAGTSSPPRVSVNQTIISTWGNGTETITWTLGDQTFTETWATSCGLIADQNSTYTHCGMIPIPEFSPALAIWIPAIGVFAVLVALQLRSQRRGVK